jgi:hypothetical protein
VSVPRLSPDPSPSLKTRHECSLNVHNSILYTSPCVSDTFTPPARYVFAPSLARTPYCRSGSDLSQRTVECSNRTRQNFPFPCPCPFFLFLSPPVSFSYGLRHRVLVFFLLRQARSVWDARYGDAPATAASQNRYYLYDSFSTIQAHIMSRGQSFLTVLTWQ